MKQIYKGSDTSALKYMVIRYHTSFYYLLVLQRHGTLFYLFQGSDELKAKACPNSS